MPSFSFCSAYLFREVGRAGFPVACQQDMKGHLPGNFKQKKMKMLMLCLTFILVTILTSLLLSEKKPSLQISGEFGTMDFFLRGKIFYKDHDNNILLIDFKEIDTKLTLISVIRNEEILLEENVSNFSKDSIYELDLNTYATGDYKVTLTTEGNEIIEEHISIIM